MATPDLTLQEAVTIRNDLRRRLTGEKYCVSDRAREMAEHGSTAQIAALAEEFTQLIIETQNKPDRTCV